MWRPAFAGRVIVKCGRTKTLNGRGPRRKPWVLAAQFSVQPTERRGGAASVEPDEGRS